jgi:hypothetical protein
MTQEPAPLQKLLLIGTARARHAADGLQPELQAVLHPAVEAAEVTQEERLWLSAGALHLWNRAGHVPPPLAAPAAATACGPEHLLACPARAESPLSLLLQGGQPAGVLVEWLTLLRGHGARLPERFLPNMLDMAARQPALQPLVRAVLGARGAWLAKLEPAWQWARQASNPGQRRDEWLDGSLDQRKAALEEWRSADASAAREALRATWNSEPPEHRAALLPCLRVNLGPDDEAFLEDALDDRRKEVRLVAQRLLAQLPGSALSRRMLVRLSPLLQLERRILRGPRLEVRLPQERDEAMRRDGAGEGTHAGLGEKAGWLVDMLAAIDPRHWTGLFELSPAQCIALSADTEFEHALLRGWTSGLQQHLAQTPAGVLLEWLDALTRSWLSAQAAVRNQYLATLPGIYATLPPAVAHAALLRLIQDSPPRWDGANDAHIELLHRLANNLDACWPPALSHAIVLRLLATLATLPAQQHWAYRSALSVLAQVLDPATVTGAQQQWADFAASTDGWQDSIDKFLQIVRFRHEMHLSFQEPA